MTLPVEGAKGYIEALDDEVLGVVDLNNPYSEVKLEAKIIPISEEQNWHRGNANENGWFLLKNPHTGKVLTKVGNSYTTIDGNKIVQLICILNYQVDLIFFLGSATLKNIGLYQPHIFSGCGPYFSGPCLLKLQLIREEARLPLLFWGNGHL